LIVFTLTELAHPNVPKTWLAPLLEASELTPLR
jgi:hypothetical protein